MTTTDADKGMVERLAYAFHRSQFADDEGEEVIAEKWREWSFDHERYTRRVRIILETLKTPSEGMTRAGRARSNFKDPTLAGLNAMATWTAMVDAALEGR